MKVNMKRFLLISILLIPAALSASDFGIVLSQNAILGNFTGEDGTIFEYHAGLFPRFSTLFGDSGRFTAIAGLSIESKGSNFNFIPELLHIEYQNHFDVLGGLWLSAGRIPYSDPLGYIAEGIFDGVNVTHASPLGRFGFGLWYSGLLYKKNINIEMTNGDRTNNDTPFEFNDFAGTYFAPSRLITAFDYEHPSLFEMLRINASVMMQFDLNGWDETINSQYLSVKAGLPVERFLFEAGGILQTAQVQTEAGSDFNLAFAGDLGVYWYLPAENNSLLSLNMMIAGGKTSDIVGAFKPIVSKNQGRIFQPILSALTVIKLNYSARLSESIGTSITASYFIRNDKVSYNNFNILPEGEGFFLGPELYARLVWNPVSDLQLNLGAGIFAPALGDAAPNSGLQWRVDLAVIFSIY